MTWTGGPWVADTSAWARAREPEIAPRWIATARAGELVACPVITLELLHDSRTRDEVKDVAAALAALLQAPITRSVTDAAIGAVRDLANRGADGNHRVPTADALIAAAAAERGFGVLHYDHDFDRLAEVLSFTSQWIAPAGSVD
ncbi:MAG: PIN domain-containing protein [Acidimicrobiales bacterium]